MGLKTGRRRSARRYSGRSSPGWGSGRTWCRRWRRAGRGSEGAAPTVSAETGIRDAVRSESGRSLAIADRGDPFLRVVDRATGESYRGLDSVPWVHALTLGSERSTPDGGRDGRTSRTWSMEVDGSGAVSPGYRSPKRSPTVSVSVGPPGPGVHSSVSGSPRRLGLSSPPTSFQTSIVRSSGSTIQYSSTPKCR